MYCLYINIYTCFSEGLSVSITSSKRRSICTASGYRLCKRKLAQRRPTKLVTKQALLIKIFKLFLQRSDNKFCNFSISHLVLDLDLSLSVFLVEEVYPSINIM